MRKQTPKLEWIVAESEADWEHLSAQPPLASNLALFRKHTWWRIGALLLLLVGVSGWLWHTDSALPQPPVNLNLPPTPPTDALLATQVISDVQAALAKLLLPESTAWTVEFSRVELRGQRAVVSLVTGAPSSAPVYRQTLFYQHTDAGWQQTEPDAALWGPEQTLETTSFVFRFGEKDRQTVSAVAPQIEALYTTLHRNFGLILTLGGKKPVIEVSVTQNPGSATRWFDVAARLSVPSPARYLVPVALSDDQILAQSIGLSLLDAVMVQVVAKNEIRAAWQPLRNGLRLWQLWHLDLPLATWRDEVVTWIYRDVPTTSIAQAVVLPKDYATLCAMHRLWLPRPWQLGIPLRCAGLDQGELYRVWWSQRQPPIHLAQLGLPVPSDADREIATGADGTAYPGQTIVLATLVEYAVATYGRERLPALVAGLGQHESWATLIPAVYGVSTTEFEAGWQAHLVTHYGISLATVRS